MTMRMLDSTTDLRYVALPMRPPGNDGYTEEQFTVLVTRDSMIGNQRCRAHPATVCANSAR